LPPNVYHGLVHLTNNAAAVLTLVVGLAVSLIGLAMYLKRYHDAISRGFPDSIAFGWG